MYTGRSLEPWKQQLVEQYPIIIYGDTLLEADVVSER